MRHCLRARNDKLTRSVAIHYSKDPWDSKVISLLEHLLQGQARSEVAAQMEGVAAAVACLHTHSCTCSVSSNMSSYIDKSARLYFTYSETKVLS